MGLRRIVSAVCLLYACAFCASAEGVTVAGVQLKVSPEMYQSESRFMSEIESRVAEIVETHHPDLIVFPEYSSAFLALVPFSQEITGALTMVGALALIQSGGLVCSLIEDDMATRFGQEVNLLLVSQATNVERMVRRVFGTLAEKYGVYIAAGTYLALDDTNFFQPVLRNRLEIFGPTGSIVHSQDKVFLTDYEKDLIGITSGKFSETDMLELNNQKIAFTICRDTFLTKWEEVHQEADLWIDIKAEGEVYSAETDRRFALALPSRIASSPVPYGFTICLNGEFFELIWEGKSSTIKKTTDGIETLSLAQSVRDEEVLVLRLP